MQDRLNINEVENKKIVHKMVWHLGSTPANWVGAPFTALLHGTHFNASFHTTPTHLKCFLKLVSIKGLSGKQLSYSHCSTVLEKTQRERGTRVHRPSTDQAKELLLQHLLQLMAAFPLISVRFLGHTQLAQFQMFSLPVAEAGVWLCPNIPETNSTQREPHHELYKWN